MVFVFQDPDDIYDVVMTTQETTSGFNNIRARFESSQPSAAPTPPKAGAKPALKDKMAMFQNDSKPNGLPAKKTPTPPKTGGKPPLGEKPVGKPPVVAPKTLKVDQNDSKPPPISPKNIASMFEKKVQNDTNNNNDKPGPAPKPKPGKLASSSFLHKLENEIGGNKVTDNRNKSVNSEKTELKKNNSIQRKETLDVKLSSKPIVNIRNVSQIEDVDVENSEDGDIVMDKSGLKYKEWPLPMKNTGAPPKKKKKPPNVDLTEFLGEI